MAEAELTLYEMNQQIMAQQPALSKEDINAARETFNDFMTKERMSHGDTYFMFLCREKYDYTVFHFKNYNLDKCWKNLIDIAQNRGRIKGIDISENGDMLEIWIEDHAYYLFAYDWGVIEIE